MTEVPEGFARRQGVSIGLISRYARLYLKSVFKRVFVVKGIITSEFRKIWGIQDEYSKKERVNHVHHCIDAITIACIGRSEYDRLAQYYHEDDDEQAWFERLKDLSEELGYAREVKDYKENPDKYKGHVGDVSMVLRVAITTKSQTPNLYQIIKLFGKERLEKRLKELIK